MIDPFDAYAWNNKGVAFSALGGIRGDQVLRQGHSYPAGYTTAWKNKVVALQALGR